MGLGITILVLLLALSSKFFLVGARIWLASWSSEKSLTSEARDKYLLVYGLLGLGHCAATYLSAILLTFAACYAAKQLHDKLLKNVLCCPMQFFETTPMGRLTNRFSKDIDVIDEDIPETFNSFIGCLFGIVSVIFTISYSTPLFLAALLPIAVIYVVTQVAADSFVPIFSFDCLFIRFFISSFIHSFMHLLFRSFVRSFVHSIAQFVRSFIHSVNHSLIHQLVYSDSLSFLN